MIDKKREISKIFLNFFYFKIDWPKKISCHASMIYADNLISQLNLRFKKAEKILLMCVATHKKK